MTALLHLDLSALVTNPLRTGIQRVEREAIRHWPDRKSLRPCLVDADGWRELSHEALDVLCADDSGTAQGRRREREALALMARRGRRIGAETIGRLLNLELFYDRGRAEAHLALVAHGTPVLWYVYDFLPYLRPQLFPTVQVRDLMEYLRALRSVTRLSFLSAQTRNEYIHRVGRRVAEWPVLLPGANGLGLERQVFSPDRRAFVAIGTVEHRKNIVVLLTAFAELWHAGIDAPLVIAGRVPPGTDEARHVRQAQERFPLLTVLDEPSDATLREVLRGARAIIMPSEAEGFGLPPYEGLHAGIPAIASARLPSLSSLADGVALLQHMNAQAIADAVTSLVDDSNAAAAWASAAAVQLPSWEEFARNLFNWAYAD